MPAKVKFLQMIYDCYYERLAETLVLLHLIAFTVLKQRAIYVSIFTKYLTPSREFHHFRYSWQHNHLGRSARYQTFRSDGSSIQFHPDQ